MTTTVSNYIYDKYNERGLKSFEKKVSQLLRKNGIKGHIVCLNAGMERSSGRGSYNKVAEIEVNGEDYTLKSHTNDSVLWDSFEATTNNKRQLFLAVLTEKIEELCKNTLD